MTVVLPKYKRVHTVLPHCKRTLLSLAVAAATSTATMSWAQEAETIDESEQNVQEEVVVTGIRRSLIDSINTKRFATTVVEAISAEDIGKLPDSSIAESIARLPGLAAQRLDGRSSSVSIRGLGEDFSATTLNGREQVSIGDNRGIEFDLYPSEIIAGVTVYKSPDASLMSQGIAGVIDLKTVKPLDYDERTIQLNYQYEEAELGKLNPDGEDKGQRATFSYIDQFNDGAIGVALALATMDSPSQEERWNAWGYPVVEGTNNFVLGGAKPFIRSSELERDTYMGVVEFAPNDKLHVTADALYIDFSDEKILRGIEIPGYWGGDTTVNTVQNGLVTEGVFEDRKVQIRNDFEKREAELTAFGLNVAYNLTDTLTVVADASHSEVERDVWSLESYSGVGRADDNSVTDDIGFSMSNFDNVKFNPQLDYSDRSLVQLGGTQNWGNGVTVPSDGQDGFINMPHIEDELDSLKLSVRKLFDSGLITAVEAGINYSDRTKQKSDTGVFLTLPQYPGRLAIPDEYYVGTVSLDFIGMGDMVAYDSFGFWQDGNYNVTEEDLTVISRSTNDWSVTEEILTSYVKADFDTEVSGLQLSGNLGVQVVQTDQSSKGNAVQDNNGTLTVQRITDGDEYTEILPSLNLSLHLTEEQILRFAASRTMSRSRMDRMNASFSYGFDEAQNVVGGTPFTASGGNPKLQPNIANQYDLSYEYYFSDEGYVSVAAFYKDLRNWQIQQDVAFDMADLIPAEAFPDTVLSTKGLANLWVSSKGGEITGYELTGSIPGIAFSPYLEGFGAILSATFIDSSLKSEDGAELAVPGLSEEIYNATVYYERYGFQVRASMRKRDDFQGERFGTSFTRESAQVVGSEVWDAQIAYDFGEAGFDSLDGLSVSLQAQNLTDEPYVTLNPETGLVTDYQVYGRTYLLGVGYKF